MPFCTGEYKLKIPCWRPEADFYDKLIGAYPELINKNILFTSDSRYGLKTESTGYIMIEVSVMTKDFHLMLVTAVHHQEANGAVTTP